jgi:DNA replication protein DnaC
MIRPPKTSLSTSKNDRKMNTEITAQQLRDMKLHGMAEQYQAILGLPLHQHPQAHQLIAQLAQAELLRRTENRTTVFLKLSKLRYAAMMEEIAWDKDRNLNKESLLMLADCAYLRRAENVLITGATGSGKSFLACALGHQACIMGHKTLYLNMNRFTEKLMLSKLDGTFNKLLNQLEKVQLLILDDFGLSPLDQNTRLALLQILEDRYGRKATLVASQLPVAQWHDFIGDPTLADAILDRLLPSAHRFELKGDSMRRKSKAKN